MNANESRMTVGFSYLRQYHDQLVHLLIRYAALCCNFYMIM